MAAWLVAARLYGHALDCHGGNRMLPAHGDDDTDSDLENHLSELQDDDDNYDDGDEE